MGNNLYSKQEILEKLQISLVSIDFLYKQDFINYKGVTKDTKELYTEVIAEYLLSYLDIFKNISQISRRNDYHVKTHNGTTQKPDSNRTEERIALGMYNKEYAYIGKVRNYQVPLKDKRSDIAGKIDLVSEKEGNLILIELKAGENNETLLRCVLEIVTYWYVADHEKLCKEFSCNENSKVKKAVFVPLNGIQHKEYNNQNSNIRKLMEKLEIDCYVFDDQIKVSPA